MQEYPLEPVNTMSSGKFSTRMAVTGRLIPRQPRLWLYPYAYPVGWVHLESLKPVTFQAAAVEIEAARTARERCILMREEKAKDRLEMNIGKFLFILFSWAPRPFLYVPWLSGSPWIYLFSPVPVVTEANRRRLQAPISVRPPWICVPAVTSEHSSDRQKCGDDKCRAVVAFQV